MLRCLMNAASRAALTQQSIAPVPGPHQRELSAPSSVLTVAQMILKWL